MAYGTYLIKVGNYEIPLSYIQAETYNCTKNGQDLDSYRDCNGLLHRTALPHPVWKIEFNTRAMLSESEMRTMLTAIQNNYINATEKSANVTFYDFESGTYITQKMYMPDIQFTPYWITNSGNTINYNSVRLAFIGY